MTLYTIEIPTGTARSLAMIDFDKTHPQSDPDTWSALLDWEEEFLTANLKGNTVSIYRDGVKIFGGYVEETQKKWDGELGKSMLVSGRCYKRDMWKRHVERLEVYPPLYKGDLVKLLSRPIKGGDINEYNRSQWGVDNKDWVVTALNDRAGHDPWDAVDRLHTTYWDNGDLNGSNGDWIQIDLGSSKTIAGIIIENRLDTTVYPEDFRIDGGAAPHPLGLLYSRTANTCQTIIASWTPAAMRYIEISLTANQSRKWHIGNIFVFEAGTALTGLTLGTINDVKVSDTEWEKFEFSFARINECNQKIADGGYGVAAEWWIDVNGNIQFQTRRGSDLSGSVSFVVGTDKIEDMVDRETIYELGNRIKILGKGEDHEQDMVSSDWEEDAASIASYTEYERVVAVKKVEYKDDADLVAELYEDILKNAKQTVRFTFEDKYATNTWGVGDDVTVTNAFLNLSSSFRVKKEIRHWDNNGETVVVECGNVWRGVEDSLLYLENAIAEIVSMREMRGGYVAREITPLTEEAAAQVSCDNDAGACDTHCRYPQFCTLATISFTAEEYVRNRITRIQAYFNNTNGAQRAYLRIRYTIDGGATYHTVRLFSTTSNAATQLVDFPAYFGSPENTAVDIIFEGSVENAGGWDDAIVRGITVWYNRCSR